MKRDRLQIQFTIQVHRRHDIPVRDYKIHSLVRLRSFASSVVAFPFDFGARIREEFQTECPSSGRLRLPTFPSLSPSRDARTKRTVTPARSHSGARFDRPRLPPPRRSPRDPRLDPPRPRSRLPRRLRSSRPPREGLRTRAVHPSTTTLRDVPGDDDRRRVAVWERAPFERVSSVLALRRAAGDVAAR